MTKIPEPQVWRRLLLGLALTLALSACASGNRPLQLIEGAGQRYPAQARAQGVEGYVVVRYNVTVQGLVEGAKVIKAEPPKIFDTAALAAVRSWRFNPPVIDGVKQPVADLESTLTFTVGDAGAYDQY